MLLLHTPQLNTQANGKPLHTYSTSNLPTNKADSSYHTSYNVRRRREYLEEEEEEEVKDNEAEGEREDEEAH